MASSSSPTSSRSSSSARLGRSMSDVTDTRPRPPSRPLHAAASRSDTKASLPRQKIKALENFVKFGRKGKAQADAPQFPPSSWFQEPGRDAAPSSGPTISTSPRSTSPVNHSSTPSQDARIRDNTILFSDGTVAAKPNFQCGPSPPPELSNNLNRPGTAETGMVLVHAEGANSTTSSFFTPGGGDMTPTLERPYASVPGTPEAATTSVPEPMTLAKRIQALMSTHNPAPTPSATDATSSFGSSDTAALMTPLDGQPSMPPPPPPTVDPGLIAMLTNASIMNGSFDKGRQSVFAILDRLRSRPAPPPPASDAVADGRTLMEEYSGNDSDDESVMLYGPLEPDEDSEVEIARSDVMSMYDDGEMIEYERPAQRLSMLRSPLSISTVLPPGHEEPVAMETEAAGVEAEAPPEAAPAGWFETWKGKVVEGGKILTDKVVESTKTLKEKTAEGGRIVQTKIRWVPSPDKISFQATWWGYRLYLPPPVLDVLNNKRLVAAKRAAILTTALQWLLGHVPLTVVPLQFRPGLLVAQRVVPYIGYIGGFVAWSWGAMRSFDKGYGIMLTATWLLPLALIPGTWEAGEVVFPQPEIAHDGDEATMAEGQSPPVASSSQAAPPKS